MGEKGASGTTEQDDLSDTFGSVFLVKGSEKIDLLTEEAKLNTYYKNEEFSIQCESIEKHDKYILYSGDKKIAESGSGDFSQLRISQFTVEKPVYLSTQDGGKESVRRKL